MSRVAQDGYGSISTNLGYPAGCPLSPDSDQTADIVGAVQSGGYSVFLPTDGKARGLDALDVFKTCVQAAARYFTKQQ